MRLLIQIPCFNEERTLADVVRSIPREIEGITSVTLQVVDDGSTDRTAELAREIGVDHVIAVGLPNRKWLGRAFRIGIAHALERGFDIFVNTDADNQYPSNAIPDLVRPILDGSAQITIGDRQPGKCKYFSPLKRFLHRLGNCLIALFCNHRTYDSVSGFRAFTFDALSQMDLSVNDTYTLDTLMQAYRKRIPVKWVPVIVNPPTRPSRLFDSLTEKVWNSVKSITRLSLNYYPLRFFSTISLIVFMPGVLVAIAMHSSKLQSLVLVAGVLTLLVGIAARFFFERGTRYTIEFGVVTGNIEDKQNLSNPISRFLVSRFDRALVRFVRLVNPASIHDVGGGEGRLAEIMREAFSGPLRITDISSNVIQKNHLIHDNGCTFAQRNIYNLLPDEDGADVVCCCEVLEHLPEPERALAALHALNARRYIFSVPCEPLWRILNLARLRYVQFGGNTPGHVQHWSRRSFIDLLSRNNFEVLEAQSPIPWTMVLARRISKPALAPIDRQKAPPAPQARSLPS